MRDPWESEVSTQQIPEELTQQDPRQSTTIMSKQQIAGDTALQKQPTKPKQAIPTSQGLNRPAGATGLLQLNRENLIQGVIWAEILGKPKAKRGRLQL